MRALVTGALGFVAKHLVDHLVSQGDDIVLVDHRAGQLGPIPVNVADVCDGEAIRSLVHNFVPDVIYHLAGVAFAPDAERDFSRAFVTNACGTFAVCDAAASCNRSISVLAVSSSEVYGRIHPQELPVVESTPVRPIHNYGLSKAMAELACHRFEGLGGIHVVIARAFNHIGPGQRVDFVVPNFAKQLAEIGIGRREPVLRVGNLSAERDFTDVRDVVRGYRLAATRGRGIYNFCSGVPVAIQTVLDELRAISGADVEIVTDPARMRPSEIPTMYGSFKKAETELAWRPEITRKGSLEEIYEEALAAVKSESPRS